MHAPGATDYPAEFELLCLGARTTLEPVHVAQISQLVAEGLDWPRFTQLAMFHRVHPLLYHSLTAIECEGIPAEVEAWLKQAALVTAARNLHLAHELGRVIRLLNSNDIPAIPFKGPVLAQAAYGNVGLRPCTDLDLLIPAASFSAVERILLADAYTPAPKVQDLTGLRKAFYVYRTKQFAFVREPMLGLDVHTAIMPPGYAYPVAFDDLLQRAHPLSVASTTLPNIAAEDLVQILCFHGIKNRCEALKYFCDIAELVHATPELDWTVVLERADQMRGERILYLGLHLADRLLGLPLPDVVAARIDQSKPVQQLGAWLAARLPHQMDLGMAHYRERLRFQLLVQPSLANKLRYCLYSLVRQF